MRNSGASAVVEGVGNHGCEYMTGGVAVILGPVGTNFAAGMSGGVAFVLDERHLLYRKLNKEMVRMEAVTEKSDALLLKGLIEEHVAATGSQIGRKILDDLEHYLPCFKKIIPVGYSKMLRAIASFEEKGMSRQQAEVEAFYALTANG